MKAGFTERLIAIFIDTLILGFIGGALFVGARGPGGVVGFAIGVAYQWFFLTRNNGQTPGKMLMNIRVVKKDGSAIGDADAIVRYVGYYLNTAIFLLGWLWALVDRDGQGLHDKLVNTMVVRA